MGLRIPDRTLVGYVGLPVPNRICHIYTTELPPASLRRTLNRTYLCSLHRRNRSILPLQALVNRIPDRTCLWPSFHRNISMRLLSPVPASSHHNSDRSYRLQLLRMHKSSFPPVPLPGHSAAVTVAVPAVVLLLHCKVLVPHQIRHRNPFRWPCPYP